MTSPFQTPLCDLLGVRYPILQAPTGSVAGPELAAAVSQAGGLGSMGVTWHSEDALREQIAQALTQTSAPFAVNYALAFDPKTLPAALEAGALIVTFSWGDPAPYLPLVRSFGAKIGAQATSVLGVRRLVELGVDFVICQGIEAGGHVQSNTPLWELLPKVAEEAAGVPVVAAGGIGTGADIAKALQMGAAGAMLGTRFVATQESRAHDLYKRKLVEATATALTVCFDGGWTYAAHRVLRNTTLEAWEAAGSPPSGKRPGEGEAVAYSASGEPILRYEDTAPRLGMTGDLEAMCLYAGTSCAAVRSIPSATDALAQLVSEFHAALNIA